jgi:hypothetical protein
MKGARARGLAYQKKVKRLLQKTFRGVESAKWIEFCDANGGGFAQPDFFLVAPDRVLLFEAKLSEVDAGYVQLEQLYKPLLQHIFKCPVVSVLVCRTVWGLRQPLILVRDPKDLLSPRVAYQPSPLVWHFLGA